MKAPLKYGIIAAAWIIYLLIGIAGGSGSGNDSSGDNKQPSSSVSESSSDITPSSSIQTSSEDSSAEHTETSEPS